MKTSLSRRGFLAAIGGAAALPMSVVPTSKGGLASASAAEIIASSPAHPAYAAAGRAMSSPSPGEDLLSWLARVGGEDGDACRDISSGNPEDLPEDTRCCDRCGGAADETSGFEVAGEYSCADCLGYGEAVGIDEELGIRMLADLILSEGEDFARETVAFHEETDPIDESVWTRAAALAAARTPEITS